MQQADIKEARDISNKTRYIKRNLLAPKELSLPYIGYRIARPALKVYNRILKSRLSPAPWMTPASIEILDRLLTKDMNGLEYGSGTSTLFFGERLGALTSVEHDEKWHQIVAQQLEQANLNHVNYYLIVPDQLETNLQIEARNRQPFDGENENYLTYYELTNTFNSDSFDIIIIDGRARVECAKRCVDKLKSGGIMVLDNSERTRYQPAQELFQDWELINTTTGLTDTSIWFKP